MKVQMRTCATSIVVLLMVGNLGLFPSTVEAGVFNDMMRHFGVGWSDGYHAGNSRQGPRLSRVAPPDESQQPHGIRTAGSTAGKGTSSGAPGASRPISPSVIARRAEAQRQAELARQRQLPAHNAGRVSARPAP